jgi:hypothetical protein
MAMQDPFGSHDSTGVTSYLLIVSRADLHGCYDYPGNYRVLQLPHLFIVGLLLKNDLLPLTHHVSYLFPLWFLLFYTFPRFLFI